MRVICLFPSVFQHLTFRPKICHQRVQGEIPRPEASNRTDSMATNYYNQSWNCRYLEIQPCAQLIFQGNNIRCKVLGAMGDIFRTISELLHNSLLVLLSRHTRISTVVENVEMELCPPFTPTLQAIRILNCATCFQLILWYFRIDQNARKHKF